jgi:phage tail-like protein
MAGEAPNTTWPMAAFYFSVNIDDTDYPFQEVSGLETETQIIEYRTGDSKQFSTTKMPGIAKIENIMLKKGVFVKDNNFTTWLSSTMQMSTIIRKTIIIKLLDQTGKPTMTWTLQKAWPVKFQITDLESDGNEVAVETIEIAYETLVISNP